MSQTKAGKVKPKRPSANQEVHVRDCMVWPDPSRKVEENQRTTYVLLSKGEIGKPNNRHYVVNPDMTYNMPPPGDDDHVIDALRGWPNKKTANNGDEQMFHYNETELKEHDTNKRKSNKKKTGKSQGHNRRTVVESDPHIAELIAHSFLNEAAEQRRKEEEARSNHARQQAKKARERAMPTSIKSTKASQLRSIALAGKLDQSPLDLWQMPKFRNNALPALNTNIHKQRQSSVPVAEPRKHDQENPDYTTGYGYEDYSPGYVEYYDRLPGEEAPVAYGGVASMDSTRSADVLVM